MILFWITIFASSRVLSNEPNSNSISIISIVFISLSLINLILTKIQKPYLGNSFKWWNAITIVVFSIYGLGIFMYIYVDDPYAYVHRLESTMILSSSILILSSLFSYVKCNHNTFKHTTILILFILSLIVFTGFSIMYHVSQFIPRPTYTFMNIFSISMFTFFCIDYVKYLKHKIIKKIYIGIIFLFLLLFIIVGVGILVDLQNDFNAPISESIVFLFLFIAVTGYSIKRLYSFKIHKKSNDDVEIEQLNYDKEQEVIKNKKNGFFSKYLDGMVSVSFKKDTTGRTIYFPFGNRGRGRIITDTKMEESIRSLTKQYLKIIFFTTIILGILQILDFIYLLALAGVSMLWFYYQIHKHIKNCEYSEEKITRKETMKIQASMYSIGFLWAFLIVSLLFEKIHNEQILILSK